MLVRGEPRGGGVARQVIHGEVRRGGAPAGGAYVQVLDQAGEFTGERRTGADGAYRFYLSPGRWSLVAFAPGVPRIAYEVDLGEGEERRLDLDLEARSA
jgi:hypothetical protein